MRARSAVLTLGVWAAHRRHGEHFPRRVMLVPVASSVFITALFTLNAVGFCWGWLVGDLRWRYALISTTGPMPVA